MRCHSTGARRLTLSALLALSALVAAPGVASAACDGLLSQPFLALGDGGDYRLVDGGDFESGAAGWALSDGTAVVADNESFYVHGAADVSALAIPAGGSATTPPVCSEAGSPVSRFFARQLGDGKLEVDVLYDSPGTAPTALGAGVVQAGADWAATRRVLAAPGASVTADETGVTWVRYRYTAVGAEVRIDDVYVDPRRH